MGPSLSTPSADRAAGAALAAGTGCSRVCSLVRYRFFLYAGLLPYLLGAAWAYAMAGAFDAAVFWSGLGGVVLAVIGVEAFNEYFDSRMGTDRVFNPAGPAADVRLACSGSASPPSRARSRSAST